MPFTAELAGEVIDATRVSDPEWARLHRIRPRPELGCRGCGTGMHAKVSKAGQRFFAHDRKTPGCPTDGETAEHRRVKAAVAAAARSVGLRAELEVASDAASTGEGWRADVLVSDEDRRRLIAFEVQLSAMTVDVGEARTARYARDGIDVVWVALRASSWLAHIPSVRLDLDSSTINVGVVRPEAVGADWVQWEHVDIRLDRFIRTLFSGRLVAAQVDGVRVPSTSAYGEYVTPGWVFTKPEIVENARDKAAAARRRREREERESNRQQEQLNRWLANTAALHERQQRVTDALITELTAASDPPPFLVIGDGRSQPPPVDWAKIERKGLSANGIPVRVVDRSGHPQLVAVVCPVAARITSKMAGFWAANGVDVVVADGSEADRVGAAMGPRAASRIRVLRTQPAR